MTRYTKLDGRKAPHKATDLTVAPAEQLDSSPTAGPSATPAAANIAADDGPRELKTAGSSEPAAAPLPTPEPKEIQARLKLLRLKLKKAKTDAKKAELNAQVKTLHADLRRANGEQGKLGGPSTQHPQKQQKLGKRDRQGNVAAAAAAAAETNPWKKMEAERRVKTSARSEDRREKRVAEREAQTRCYACRSMGHSARDCPEAVNSNSTALDEGDAVGGGGAADAATDVEAQLTGRETVGICFRCGSTEHILAKCRKAAPRGGPPLPFAVCFVCKGKVSTARITADVWQCVCTRRIYTHS